MKIDTTKTLFLFGTFQQKRKIPFSLIASSQPEDEIDSQKYYYSDENFLISAAAKYFATTLPAPQKKSRYSLSRKNFIIFDCNIEMLVMNS